MATVWLAAREWRWAWSTELSIHLSPWIQARADDCWGYLQLHVDEDADEDRLSWCCPISRVGVAASSRDLLLPGSWHLISAQCSAARL